MRVLLLGTTGYHPTDDRETACMLLPELGIAFDAGTGFFRVARHLTTPTLDIFLSHAHLDHVAGLTYFFSLMVERPQTKITVHGDEGKLNSIRDHLFAEDFFPARAPFDWRPATDTFTHSSGAVLRSFRLEHPGGSRGYRLEIGGKSMAYVTDTTARSGIDYIEHIRGVDLLLHESNFPSGQDELARKTGHSCLDHVARVAKEAQVKRAVLVHFDPLMAIPPADFDAARKIFSALEPGHDNLEVTF